MTGNLIYDKVKIVSEDNFTTSVQHPVPTDSDSVYQKDIDIDNCDNGGFTGQCCDYFNDLKTVNTDVSSTNPKYIKLWFKRTVYSSSIGFGCDNLSKSFSNIKLSFLGSGEEVRVIVDNSSDSTKRNSYLIEFEPTAFNGILIQFYTADSVSVSNLTIPKEVQVAARLKAKKDNGVVVDIGATNDGNLRISDAENGLAIAAGDVPTKSYIHKFGNAPDFATADGAVTVWDGADAGGIDQMVYVYSTTADIDSISSSSTADTQLIKIQGLDANYNLVTQEATLQGQARVALNTPLIRVFRMKNDNSVDNAGNVYCFVNTTLALGIPVDTTKVRSMIQVGYNQTLMAIYTIPNGYTGYMRDWYASTAGASKTSNYIIELRAREYDSDLSSHKVFQLKHVTAISDSGTSYIQHKYEEPEMFASKVDVEMRATMTAVGGSGASIAAGFDIVLIQD